jgi:hypothetical protein
MENPTAAKPGSKTSAKFAARIPTLDETAGAAPVILTAAADPVSAVLGLSQSANIGTEGYNGVVWKKSGDCRECWAWKIRRYRYAHGVVFFVECVEITCRYWKICANGDAGRYIEFDDEHCEVGSVDKKFPEFRDIKNLYQDYGAEVPPAP